MSIQENIARLKTLRTLMINEPWAVKLVQTLTEQIQDLEAELLNPRKEVLDLPVQFRYNLSIGWELYPDQLFWREK